jgi:hypothetical protein
MATDRVLRLERWGVPYGYEEREWTPASEEELSTIIQTLDKESSAILVVESGDDWLTMSASEGRFSVMVRFGEESPFDLVGDVGAYTFRTQRAISATSTTLSCQARTGTRGCARILPYW